MPYHVTPGWTDGLYAAGQILFIYLSTEMTVKYALRRLSLVCFVFNYAVILVALDVCTRLLIYVMFVDHSHLYFSQPLCSCMFVHSLLRSLYQTLVGHRLCVCARASARAYMLTYVVMTSISRAEQCDMVVGHRHCCLDYG